MKLSEVIRDLSQFKDEVGDVEVVSITDVDSAFCIENRYFEIVEIPNEDETETSIVVAFMETPETRLEIV